MSSKACAIQASPSYVGGNFLVLATAGDTFLGGEDIDLALVDRMAEIFLTREEIAAMRDVPELKIERIWINIYHGGTWAADSDDHLFIDNVVIAKKYIGPMTPLTNRK